MNQKTIKLLGTVLTVAFASANLSFLSSCEPSKKSAQSKFNKGLGKRVDKAKQEHKYE